MCVSTVRGDRNISAAISWFDSPRATACVICCSRAVRQYASTMIGAICADFAGAIVTAIGPGAPPYVLRAEACTESHRPDDARSRTAAGPRSSPSATACARATAAYTPVIDKGSADDAGYHVGDTVPVITKAGRNDYKLTGIVKFGSENSLLGATIAAFAPNTATRLLGTPASSSRST